MVKLPSDEVIEVDLDKIYTQPTIEGKRGGLQAHHKSKSNEKFK